MTPELTEKKEVAIVTPVYKTEIDGEDEIALRHLEHYLGDHDRFFFAPQSLRPRRPGFGVVQFPDAFFRSVASYSRLLLSADFYRAFRSYEYILIYQLDCLVFSDALSEWCRTAYDYLGAPWLVDPVSPEKGFSRVGNGGFSLRRIAAFLGTLETDGTDRAGRIRRCFRAPLPDLAPYELWKRIRVLREARCEAARYARCYTLNEDRFWSDRASLFNPRFRIAPVDVALEFSFERAPQYCFSRNGGRLPFGCHAWSRWDRPFWKPFLL